MQKHLCLPGQWARCEVGEYQTVLGLAPEGRVVQCERLIHTSKVEIGTIFFLRSLAHEYYLIKQPEEKIVLFGEKSSEVEQRGIAAQFDGEQQ